MTKHTYLSEPFDLVLDRLGLSLVTLGHLPLGLYLCCTPIPCTIISVSITIALLISIVQCRRDWLGLALNLGRWLGFVGSNLMLLLLAGVVLIVGINWPLRLFHEGCPASAFATHSCAISRWEAVSRERKMETKWGRATLTSLSQRRHSHGSIPAAKWMHYTI